MCERTYCRHEHERLCSCPPVTCRDALGMAAHLAENMEQVQWSLTYNSLKDIKPYQLCLVGKCRICGGRLCMEQRPVEADSTDGFLAAVYRHLYHFHRSIGQCLPRAAFRTKFVEMFRKEDRAAIEDWLALPENSHVARMYRRSVKGAYMEGGCLDELDIRELLKHDQPFRDMWDAVGSDARIAVQQYRFRGGKQGEELGDENHFALMRAYDRALSDEDGSTFVERDDVDWLDDFELTKDDLADGK